ncbi:MAG: dephospho-CoA kinase [Flavobacteriales bacterium]|nr:MAG: dephospho-CoA kinase [Flavobacteriales bacterium]
MKIIGLTGGIGSGKTTIASLFKKKGIPIYIADERAKNITNTSKLIRKHIIELLGENAYQGHKMDRNYVSNKIFNDETLLKKINAIIHPKVTEDFVEWLKKQKGPYCIKESAILFENGNYKYCDYTILITAPEEIKIKRVMKRDQLTILEIKSRIKNQWSDDKKSFLADTIIENIKLENTKEYISKIHLYLLENINNGKI